MEEKQELTVRDENIAWLSVSWHHRVGTYLDNDWAHVGW